MIKVKSFRKKGLSNLFNEVFSVLVETAELLLRDLVQLEVVLQPEEAVRVQVVGHDPEVEGQDVSKEFKSRLGKKEVLQN